MKKYRLKGLIQSVRNLENFLRIQNESVWADSLSSVAERLEMDSALEQARVELNSFFGGMGSLNDLGFSGDIENQFGNLADEVFKRNRLLTAGVRARLRWRIYEWSNTNDLPPRILNAFAK